MSGLVTEGLTGPWGLARGDSFLLRGTDPAAGASFSFPVPGEYIARPRACVFTLATDGNAGNRFVRVEYQDGAGVAYCVNGAGVVITASSTRRFAGSSSRGAGEQATGTDVFFPLEPAYCFPGSELAIVVGTIKAGDQLSGIVFLIERFFTGPRGEPIGAVPADAVPSF